MRRDHSFLSVLANNQSSRRICVFTWCLLCLGGLFVEARREARSQKWKWLFPNAMMKYLKFLIASRGGSEPQLQSERIHLQCTSARNDKRKTNDVRKKLIGSCKLLSFHLCKCVHTRSVGLMPFFMLAILRNRNVCHMAIERMG